MAMERPPPLEPAEGEAPAAAGGGAAAAGDVDVQARKLAAANAMVAEAQQLVADVGAGATEGEEQRLVEFWDRIVRLGNSKDLDDKRASFALLCILYDCARPVLSEKDLWALLQAGLSCDECSTVRKRSLFLLGQELKRQAAATGAEDYTSRIQWWSRFFQSLETLEQVSQTHLLHQVFPIVVTLTTAVGEAGREGGGPGLPAPSLEWMELLFGRALLGVQNYAVRRTYLLWLMAQSRTLTAAAAAAAAAAAGQGGKERAENEQVLDVRRLSEAFVLRRLLPALHEVNNIRGEEREALERDTARFLAVYLLGLEAREGRQGCRRFLRAVLSYLRDGVKSGLVRMVILGAFVGGRGDDDELDGLWAAAPVCLGAGELSLARSALAACLEESNQAVGKCCADGIMALCERFTDGQEEAAAAATDGAGGGESVAASVRLLLLELPVFLSLCSWRARIGSWLERLGGEQGLLWWREATAKGVEALVSAEHNNDRDGGDGLLVFQGAAMLESSACALACFFLPSADDVAIALGPCLRVLARLHSHPYIPARAQRSALALVRSLGILARHAPHAELGAALRPCLAEPVDFLVAEVGASLSLSLSLLQGARAGAEGGGGEEEEEGEEGEEGATRLRFHVDVLGVVLGLAVATGSPLRSSVLGLAAACMDVVEVEGASASAVGGRRAVLVLRCLLQALVQYDSTDATAPVLAAIRARLASLKRGLDAAATGSRAGGVSAAAHQEHLAALWRCRALLAKLSTSGPRPRPGADASASASSSELEVEVEFLLGALDTASAAFVEDVLFCLQCALPPYVLSAPDDAGRRARLDAFVDVLLRVLEETDYNRGVASLAIDMVLHPHLLLAPAPDTSRALCEDAAGPVRRFMAHVMRVSTARKGFMLVDMAARLVTVLRRRQRQWPREQEQAGSEAGVALCFADELLRLLTMREQEESVHNRTDEEDGDGSEPARALLASGGRGGAMEEEAEEDEEKEEPPTVYAGGLQPVRLSVLIFLTELFRGGHERPLLGRLLTGLFDVAAAADVRKAQIAGSAAYSRKLRACQALAVLVPFVHEGVLPEVLARLDEAFQVMMLPTIRWHLENANAFLCMCFPDEALPCLIERVSTVNIRPQVSASLLVVVGLLCLTKQDDDGDGPEHHLLRQRLPERFVLPVLKAVLPWLSGTHVTSRVICQMVAFRLLSRAREAGLVKEDGGGGGSGGSGGIGLDYLSGTLAFLEGNREMSTLRRKEMQRFEAVSVGRNCSVAGLLDGAVEADNEFVRTHLEAELREGMTALIKQMAKEDSAALPVIMTVEQESERHRDLYYAPASDVATARSLLDSTSEAGGTFAIQQKIVVSDVLAGIPRAPTSTFENARGERLQDIIVCASLVDRLPNLAGLARTCEIFAAAKLVVPDLRVTKDPLFQSISSSAAGWVAMEEVKDVATRDYLLRMKREGYAIVGLEQASTSQCLTRARLPPRMVLLLGREKEGVPVELLAEVDLLLEIPQLGLVRSLNVHVSASLVIWEYTRQHRFACP